MGDEDFYDSDDYDVDEVTHATANASISESKGNADGDDWAPKRGGAPAGGRAQGQKSEGRMLNIAEQRAMLQRSDAATTRANGWMRGKDAARRLAAMQSMVAAYPKRHEEKQEARNPLQMLVDALWQQPPPHQARPVHHCVLRQGCAAKPCALVPTCEARRKRSAVSMCLRPFTSRSCLSPCYCMGAA